MNCPKCKAPMEAVKFQDVEVDRCTSCKGIWFDANEHQKLKGMKGAAALDIGDAATGRKFNAIGDIDCPVCHSRMIKMVDVDQHHIWIEGCEVCYGVFMDAGEFADFAKYNFADYIKGLFAKERK